ncbi:hypothetical protein PMI09_05456 [Rhizobium sp. CF122]|nr:hypothetical protein PMI09_05456 [Rhizobium sp. CF122]
MSTPDWLVLVVERHQAFHVIGSAEEALDMLFANWPTASGAAFVLAMETCAGTATGTVTQDEAQLSFLAAALDAKVEFRFA